MLDGRATDGNSVDSSLDLNTIHHQSRLNLCGPHLLLSGPTIILGSTPSVPVERLGMWRNGNRKRFEIVLKARLT